MPGRRTPPDDSLWPEHVEAFAAFLAVAGQWRCTALPNGALIWMGLDYTAAQAGLTLAGLAPSAETWAAVRQIEAGAIEELNLVR